MGKTRQITVLGPANFAAAGKHPLFGGHAQTSEVHWYRIVETIVAPLGHRDQRLIQYVAPPIVFHRRDPAPRIFGLHALYELRSSFGGTIFSSLTAFRPGHLYKFRERCESTPTNIFLLARNKSIGVVLCSVAV
jgi:hypothetical protein